MKRYFSPFMKLRGKYRFKTARFSCRLFMDKNLYFCKKGLHFMRSAFIILNWHILASRKRRDAISP